MTAGQLRRKLIQRPDLLSEGFSVTFAQGQVVDLPLPHIADDYRRMDFTSALALTLTIFAAAVLYSSVGHAGASAYLAAMALFSVEPSVMRPTALALNILVAAIATLKFYRAGAFSWQVFRPFAATAVPFAFIGGSITLPTTIYRPLVGVVLLYAAFRLWHTARPDAAPATRPPRVAVALVLGVGIGLLSGLTGVGGGIFLTPLLLLMRWAEARQAAGVSAAFILVNSIAGLLGQAPSLASLPSVLPVWAGAVVAGGWIGAGYGSRRLGSLALRRLLSVVLVIGGLKLIFG